jgi:predicted DNA-binding transcriptional regulator YafY
MSAVFSLVPSIYLDAGMAKTDRFFEIIQILRRADKPVLARDLAEELEVSRRTIYRDIATLQSMQTPIFGEAGIGYVMRKGYDLPPINFDIEEAEAVSVGLSMVARTGDRALWRAAKRAARKLTESTTGTTRLVTSSWGVDAPLAVNLSDLRTVIRDEKKIRLDYRDVAGHVSIRTVWPLILIYYVDAIILVGWCELRSDLRHFRLDRIQNCTFLSDDFAGLGGSLVQQWEDTLKDETVSTDPP